MTDRNLGRRWPARLAAVVLLAIRGVAAAADDSTARPDFDPARPVGFEAQVGPLLGLLGCNAGACHGKAGGQHGFALSLFGADTAADATAIRRRIDPLDPEASLFLRKPTGQVPHGGGTRIEPDSDAHRTLLRWIVEQSRPEPRPAEAKLVRLEACPPRQVLPRGQVGRVRVEATWDDGSVVDVTRLSRFEGGSGPPIVIREGGEVVAGPSIGVASVLIRYGSNLAVARVVIPGDGIGPQGEASAGSLVDRLVDRQLCELGVAPGPRATDAEFARRAALDIAGILPDPADVVAFERDDRPDKRSRWVDALLARPEYADHFATKWSVLLRNRRSLGDLSKPTTFALHAWVRQAIAANRPFDRFATDLIAARGDAASNPAVGWYRNVATTEERADDAAQVFLGTRIGCARCHHHPTERWTQADYAGLAAGFARIGTKAGAEPTTFRVFTVPPIAGSLAPKALGGPALGSADDRVDPRDALAAWMVGADNPYFARAVVNRYWQHFFGRGLVEPVDDLRATNPASDPDLLDALAADFRDHGHDLKHLIRMIATSAAYARTSLRDPVDPIPGGDLGHFAPRRLPAEVLLDAIDRVAGTAGRFAGMPTGTRAVQLPDDGFASAFLDAFGRPARRTACECERTAEPDLAQALILLNSPDLEAKLAAPTGRAAGYASAADPRPDATKLDELYRVALSRPPTPDEQARALDHLARSRRDGRVAAGFEDVIWALLNAREFLYNH